MTVLDGRRHRPQPHPELRLVSPRRDMDVAAAEEAVGDLLTALGADLSAEQLRDTPQQIADWIDEHLGAQEFLALTGAGRG